LAHSKNGHNKLRDWIDSRLIDEDSLEWYGYEMDSDPEYQAAVHDLSFDVFQAVDRAVCHHDQEHVRRQAHLLAAALDVSVWEIEDCIKHTRAGYINVSG
jgi:hypothetical protein